MTKPTRFNGLDIHPEIKSFIHFVSENDAVQSIPHLESLAEEYATLNPASFLDSLLVHVSTKEIVDRAAEKGWDIKDQWGVLSSIVRDISKAESIDDILIDSVIEETYQNSSIAIRNRIVEGEVATSFGYSSWKKKVMYIPAKMEMTGKALTKSPGRGCFLEDLKIEVDKPFEFLKNKITGRTVSDLITKWHLLLNPDTEITFITELGYKGAIYFTLPFVGDRSMTTQNSIDEYGMNRLFDFLKEQEGKEVTIGVLLTAETPKVMQEVMERGKV